MSYLDSGFDTFLDRTPTTSSISPQDQDATLESISASYIQSGVMQSSDGRSSLNLDESLYTVSDGLVNRVQIGKFSDGEYGLRISDQDGNLLIDITGKNNLIQSPDKKLQLDLTEKQFRVFDQFNLRVLLGEL